MVKPQTGFKIDPAILEKIDQLVEAGKYPSRTDFYLQAIQYYFNRTEFQIETEAQLIKYLLSDQGRELIRQLMKEEKEKLGASLSGSFRKI